MILNMSVISMEIKFPHLLFPRKKQNKNINKKKLIGVEQFCGLSRNVDRYGNYVCVCVKERDKESRRLYLSVRVFLSMFILCVCMRACISLPKSVVRIRPLSVMA